MAQPDTPVARETRQFDRAVSDHRLAAAPPMPVVRCAACKITIETQYYDVNDRALCGSCRASAVAAAQTPRELSTLMVSAAFGVGTAIVGAAIDYALIAKWDIRVAVLAVLIGYMVGYSVRRGAQGRGGRRFQVLAATLTYLSVALAYAPIALQHADGASVAGRAVLLTGLVLGLPILAVVGSTSSGLISAFIILLGMWQAWRMTQAPVLKIHGPYRVGGPFVEHVR